MTSLADLSGEILSSIFHTCLGGYICLIDGLAVRDTPLRLEIRFRVEAMRFRLWGECQGLMDSFYELPKKSNPLALPEIEGLILKSLGRVIQLFQKNLQTSRDILAQSEPMISRRENNATALSLSNILDAKLRLEERIKMATLRDLVIAKFRMPVHKKPALHTLLGELTAVNNALERLIPPDEAVALARGLTGEILDATLPLPILDEDSFGPRNSKAAKILQLRQLNKISFSAGLDSQSTSLADAPTPSNSPPPSTNTAATWEIPISALARCPDGIEVPNLGAPDGKIWDGPDLRSTYSYTPPGDDPKQIVLVEWHLQTDEPDCSITNKALAKRCQKLARLLHHTSAADVDFRLLLCLGYTLTTGRLPDGKQYPLVGVVYELPPDAINSTRGATLAEAIRGSGPMPSLDDRLRLAQQLALAVYQLHCAGWIHRKISSNNILYFSRRDGLYDIAKPYIGGWQYIQPDPDHSSESEWDVIEHQNMRELAAYIHPDRVAEDAGISHLQRSDDIYSLGVLLTEVALWKGAQRIADPLGAMVKANEGSAIDHRLWAESLWRAAERKISGATGVHYSKAVMACLRRLSYTNPEDENPREADDVEAGIEREFFYRVVEELRQMTPSWDYLR
ncbi:hypothetical protein BO78DRAFT_395530 [Aspergillus sclerotiicarbonarius CBS 121057]|uniref:Protein kinase domain-containing protein n=1 Tax=Aspergillus sclerotiicarbonarius (strain CBS 121057 / IBT 28362) TaxID=1448318 RepID=A0A319ELZ6_ASPSB|nr:hypothetical protein BO78DRAFT_395530 [Aspergillus sclerotiicarbonarius CBS 121057]